MTLWYFPQTSKIICITSAVFERLGQYWLKLQPQKCRFFRREVWYLGHVVSLAGVATDLDKTAAAWDWPAPETRQMRSFLGFAGYY